MAWNPSPEIATLRDFARKFGRQVVVVFSIDNDGQRFHIETYGQTVKMCKLAGAFGHQIAEAVKDGRIEPPPIEPFTAPPTCTSWIRARTMDGRSLHSIVTDCDDLWPTLDDETKAMWAQSELELLRRLSLRALVEPARPRTHPPPSSRVAAGVRPEKRA